MATCRQMPTSLLQRLFSAPLEHALRDLSARKTRLASTPTTVEPLVLSPDPIPFLGVVVLALLGGLLLRSQKGHSKNPPLYGALSEETVLRIHALAARQPFKIPPNGPGDSDPDTFSALPFSHSARKQSVSLFLLLLLLSLVAFGYALRVVWLAALAAFLSDKRHSVSWTLTVAISATLARISSPCTRSIFALLPILRAALRWTNYVFILVSAGPMALLHSWHMRVTHLVHRVLPGYPLQRYLDRLFALASSMASVLAGYHLAASRVARHYTVVLRWIARCVRVYTRVRASAWSSLLNRVQNWGWQTTKHVFVFALDGASWRSFSGQKIYVMFGPALFVIAYETYMHIMRVLPRSEFEIALDPIRLSLQQHRGTLLQQQLTLGRLAAEQTDFKRNLLQMLDRQFAALNANMQQMTAVSDQTLTTSRNEPAG